LKIEVDHDDLTHEQEKATEQLRHNSFDKDEPMQEGHMMTQVIGELQDES